MSIRITSFTTDRCDFHFTSAGEEAEANRIDILTGPNGSGKTEALTSIANAFLGVRQHNALRIHLSWQHAGKPKYTNGPVSRRDGPSRVITQTFSPFTRFPEPTSETYSLTNIYSLGMGRDQFHVAIGLYRGSRLSGDSISNHTLEEAIFRLSESGYSAKVVFDAMMDLGYQPKLSLGYSLNFQLPQKPNQSNLIEYFQRYLELYPRGESGLSRELTHTSPEELADVVGEALRQVAWLEGQEFLWRDFDIRLGLTQYSEFQSLTLLRRLDLLTLRRCMIYASDGRRVEVSDASSGQQQMLCSIIGLAAALSDDSLVLIDEPELSLHPQWQQTYIGYLLTVLRQYKGCHVLVATHSPLVVQRAQAEGIAVTRLGDDNNQPLNLPKAASVEATLVDVFETPIPSSQYLANELLSSIRRAEHSQASKELALEKLLRLYHVYAKSEQEGVSKSLGLIADAIDLVRNVQSESRLDIGRSS